MTNNTEQTQPGTECSVEHAAQPPTSCRWVVKVGSSLVTDDGLGLNIGLMADWARQLLSLRQEGIQPVLVSSGAVAAGVGRLGLDERPTRIAMLQAAAAAGQAALVQAYDSCFLQHGVHTAQVLLSHGDLSDQDRYRNARNTLDALINLDTVPVVNENDTVATAELCFGDNDTLAALVAGLVSAKRLVILTDQDGLYTADPRQDAAATLISRADVEDDTLQAMAGPGSELGRGGMQTKLSAAKLAAATGADTIIANGRTEDVLCRLAVGEKLGTRLVSSGHVADGQSVQQRAKPVESSQSSSRHQPKALTA